MNWFDILKRRTGYFNIFNTTDVVREATREWSESVKPGISYQFWLIRRQVGEILLPKLKQIAKEEGLRNQAATMFVNRYFYLKDAETSTYDKTIFNTLRTMLEGNKLVWVIKGQSAKLSTFVKL